MDPAEAWMVAWFVVAQALVAVAVWRHKGRWGGGAFWITALLGVNALATLLSLLGDLTGHWPTSFVARMVDRATNPLLLLVASAPLVTRRWRSMLVPAALATTVTGITAETVGSSWGPFVSEVPLLAAMVLSGVVLPRIASRGDPVSLRWVLVLGVLGMRFVELGLQSFVGSAVLGAPFWVSVLRIGSAAVCLGGALWVVPHSTRHESAPVARIALAFVLAGLGLGAVRLSVLGAAVPPLVFLTLGLVRPVVIFTATHAFEGRSRGHASFWASAPGRTVAAAAISAVGLWFHRFVAPDNVLVALAFSAAFAFLGLPILSLVHASSHGARAQAEIVPMDEIRQVAPPLLVGAPHWQRLLLALWCVQESGPRAFERTTPGLQHATGCPHASVGAEIRSCNRRAADIRRNLALGPLAGPLVERNWGTAEGVRSHRAAIYYLTISGLTVAETVRARLGLGGFSREELWPLLRQPEKGADRGSNLGPKLESAF